MKQLYILGGIGALMYSVLQILRLFFSLDHVILPYLFCGSYILVGFTCIESYKSDKTKFSLFIFFFSLYLGFYTLFYNFIRPRVISVPTELFEQLRLQYFEYISLAFFFLLFGINFIKQNNILHYQKLGLISGFLIYSFSCINLVFAPFFLKAYMNYYFWSVLCVPSFLIVKIIDYLKIPSMIDSLWWILAALPLTAAMMKTGILFFLESRVEKVDKE